MKGTHIHTESLSAFLTHKHKARHTHGPMRACVRVCVRSVCTSLPTCVFISLYTHETSAEKGASRTPSSRGEAEKKKTKNNQKIRNLESRCSRMLSNLRLRGLGLRVEVDGDLQFGLRLVVRELGRALLNATSLTRSHEQCCTGVWWTNTLTRSLNKTGVYGGRTKTHSSSLNNCNGVSWTSNDGGRTSNMLTRSLNDTATVYGGRNDTVNERMVYIPSLNQQR